MNDRLIFIGNSASGKSTAALGFMSDPTKTAIIQHAGSQGFRYLASIPALKALRVENVANFGAFESAVNRVVGEKRSLVIVDDYDYLFRDEQRSARVGKSGNAQRLASQPVYQAAEGVVKTLMESGATVIFTLKAVAKAADREGDLNVIEVAPFLPGLHAHMETGLVDAVIHFIRNGQKFTARTRGWETGSGGTVTRYYAKVTLGLGDYLPEIIPLEKTPGKPYCKSVAAAIESAKTKMAEAWSAPATPSPPTNGTGATVAPAATEAKP